METFSYRSLLYLTMYLGVAGAVVGYLASALSFLSPLFLSAGRRRMSVAAAGAGGGEVVAARAPVEGPSRLLRGLSWLALALCGACFLANLGAQYSRSIEVQHWPAQTMYEVIPLGTTMCFLSMLVLYFVLGLHRSRGTARGFGDLFLALVLTGCAATIYYVLGLDPSGRALPPALQSGWFSTHITAYMFGYFTLFIATLGAWLHFCFKFWRGVLERSAAPVPVSKLVGIALFSLVPVPFGAYGVYFGPGVLAVTFLIALVSRATSGGMRWFEGWEAGADRFTFIIFAVGFPFLTAGLVQGALWAQEAWAIYWGWDSKEVSALISWIFYLVYLHLRFVAGWRGERGMWILLFGGVSIYITFQLFGHLPASQSSLHRYTDMDVVPAEGMMNPALGN